MLGKRRRGGRRRRRKRVKEILEEEREREEKRRTTQVIRSEQARSSCCSYMYVRSSCSSSSVFSCSITLLRFLVGSKKNRGGKGVKTISVTDKTGSLVAIKNVTDADDLMIINKSGIAIRLAVQDLRVMGRATQGVRLINLKGKKDAIAAVAKVMHDEDNVEDIENIEVQGDVDLPATPTSDTKTSEEEE